MKMAVTCCKCGASLSGDEKALFRKLVCRNAEQFWCISCMAAHFQLPVPALQERIQFFRSSGCALFG